MVRLNCDNRRFSLEWKDYKRRFIGAAGGRCSNPGYTEAWLAYARKLYKQNVPIIYDYNHLALLIGIETEYLLSMAYAPRKFYRTFYVKKKQSGKRRIDEPLPDLKAVQRWILDEVLQPVPVSKYSKAFVCGESIKTNARFHRHQKIVLALDIVDFFGSISRRDVFCVFHDIGYTTELCWLFAHLCTFNGYLPQGAPTSPYISNLKMKAFDQAVGGHCIPKGIRFTRYADDIFISGDFDIAHMLFLSNACWVKKNSR